MKINKGVAVVATATVITLAGCGATDQIKDAKNDITQKVETGKKMVESGQDVAKKGKDMAGSLKDAMKKGVTMKCVSDTPDGHWVTYTNGKYSKVEGKTADGHEMMIVINEDATYTWDKKTKKGQKIDKKCMEEFEKSFGGSAMSEDAGEEMFDDFTPENLEVEEENGNLKCSPSTEADFSVPSDVEFTDQCKLMTEQMNKLKQQMPDMQNMMQ